MVSFLFWFFFWIGVILLAWGEVQLVIAFKNKDDDFKSRASMLISVAIAFLGVSAILNHL